VTVTHDGDSSIDFFTAVFARNDTVTIVQKDRMARRHRHSHWCHRDCDFELLGVIGKDVDVAIYVRFAPTGNVVALAVRLAHLGVVSLGHQIMFQCILKSLVSKTTIATGV